ncbi:hypothetical protein K437DRAFT_247637 [Tilletiaria anomala UBC 951]|uniref:Uncharacterized protein n=1 Tax=Tilletiaria anomala (strain ATCC 24038 / CBS 436.72 / UBC 951) TaxID=1037660 RepID=A0A066VSG9_TILAU|nr:uncharacterized protein K437DRAFT_247637 [Tilletiaria anomala UBC 951]KDN44682.1 hypothetical protein K437DRAFT_247637 [Tilletiaria anomala UBC 951]
MASTANEMDVDVRPGRCFFTTLPPEVMDTVGYYIAISSPGSRSDPVGTNAPPDHGTHRHHYTRSKGREADKARDMLGSGPPAYATPPAQLISLLLSCKYVYNMLNETASPGLYARIFKTKFDYESIARRFGQDAVDAKSLTIELKKRCRCLKRIKATVMGRRIRRAGLSDEESQKEMEENLWLAYLMMLENDGKNRYQLRWASIDRYLHMHYEQEMLGSIIKPGYPPDSVDRALSLHLHYLVFGDKELSQETPQDSEERMFVLRPYVFAAHKFNPYLAPWMVWDLPTGDKELPVTQPGMIDENGEMASEVHDPFLMDYSFQTRTCTIEHCAQKLHLAAPVLAHAACLMFFQRVERDPAAMGLAHLREGAGEAASIAEAAAAAAAGNDQAASRDSVGGWALAQVFEGMNFTAPAQSSQGRHDRRFGAFNRRRANLAEATMLRSIHHDKDFARLMACCDPRSGIGLRPSFHAGDFEGAWEGRFSFFDFDSYRDMLAGLMSSLYEGPFGEQPQVWKLKERMVRLGEHDHKGGEGSILSAGYLGTRQEAEDEQAYGCASADENRPPNDIVRRRGQNIKLFQRPTGRALDDMRSPSDSSWSWQRSSRHTRDDSQEFPSFGADELSTVEEIEYGDDPDKFELRLSGSGHSAWGRFNLQGRIRSWDGMMIMKKEYTPDGRGRWLYRGYALGGGKLVGRWRDTFTPESMSGYEGCFCLYKREQAL